MKDIKSDQCEESYSRAENFIFYPQGEVARFLNRFVRKRTDVNSFKDILFSVNPLVALDFGCGIGRNVLLFKEFGIKGYGIDISTNAINMAKKLADYYYLGDLELQGQFTTTDEISLPYGNDFFDFAVSDSVLDSMYFHIAQEIVKELDRTVKKFLFISVISDPNITTKEREIIVLSSHENGTVQGFFSLPKIHRLIEGTNWKVKWVNLVRDEQITAGVINKRYYVVLEK